LSPSERLVDKSARTMTLSQRDEINWNLENNYNDVLRDFRFLPFIFVTTKSRKLIKPENLETPQNNKLL
jgi:hypothetical protein